VSPAGGRPVILINPDQVDAFGRFLTVTQDRLETARHILALSGINSLVSVPGPPELRSVNDALQGAIQLLGTTATSMNTGASYAGEVAQLARRADAGGGVDGLQAAKAGRSLVSFAADQTIGGGAGALAKSINAAIGISLVGRTAEVVVDALAGAYSRRVAGSGVKRVVRSLGEGLRSVVTPIDDFERLKAVDPGPEVGRARRVISKIDKFLGPAGVVFDGFDAAGAVGDIRKDGLKASSGLGLGSALLGIGSVGLLFSGVGTPAAIAGGGSVLAGGGSIFAKGKEDEADRRKAEQVLREKLRRNPNTTEVLRRQGPIERGLRLRDFPPIPPVEGVPPLRSLPRRLLRDFGDIRPSIPLYQPAGESRPRSPSTSP